MKKLLITILILVFIMSASACSDHVWADNENDAAGQDVEKDGIIFFDSVSADWENASDILMCLFDLDSGEPEKLIGTKIDNGIWLFDTCGKGIQTNHAYTAVFHHADTNDETYPLLLDEYCFGDTVYANHCVIENPSDDNKKLYEVHWKRSRLGPMLRITSIGNVVGETIPANTSAYQIFVDFLASKGKESLTHALQYNGKDAQLTIDTIAGALKLTKEDVAKAIEEAKSIGNSVTGDKVDWSHEWSASKFSIPRGSCKSGDSASSP